MKWNRRDWLASLAFLASLSCTVPTSDAFAVSGSTPYSSPRDSPATMAMSSTSTDTGSVTSTTATTDVATVLFQDLSLRLGAFDSSSSTNIPVACWWPSTSNMNTETSNAKPASYDHSISVKRIGQLLAQWNFIPSFASRKFTLVPSQADRVYQGQLESYTGPVVILAHGYLGSRFDLSHLAETLAAEGFLCISPEYPESLAASYERLPGLDRANINDNLLKTLNNQWNVQGTSFGIVGHSLGTGTALTTGDDTWARVCLAGFPRQRNGVANEGNMLLICSMNDGAMSLQRFGGLSVFPPDYTMLTADDTAGTTISSLPRRAAWILDAPNAPNHISFLSAGVNDAMIDLLSPLLPVAQWANIPVLDFDRYQVSRDAVPTAALLHPVIVRYLKQEMKV